MLALDDLEAADFRTVIVTSSDVSGRLVGKRFSADVFRRLVEEGVALSSCVLGWDVDQWPDRTRRTRDTRPAGTTCAWSRTWPRCARRRGSIEPRSVSPTSSRWAATTG